MLANKPSVILGNRYEIGMILGEGGMGAVYRATDRLTNKPVAVKRLLNMAEQLQFALKAQDTEPQVSLANEFQILASLRHPNIIGVLDYGFDRRQPYYVMDVLPNARTIVQAAQGRELSFKVNLLIQTLQVLTYLHRRGILHRDLKPSNILVTANQVKVLDFGISASIDSIKTTEGVSGTLEYLAPEIFDGLLPTQATDLYAVGIIAYEIFTGTRPFRADSAHGLIHHILHTPPDVSALQYTPRLAAFLSRLLAKEPGQRFHSASDTITALCQATEQPIPPETTEIRESFLQAATFVGRTAERAKLEEALTDARNGKGSMWLIAGESGIGKSRLVNELHTHALVQGALVLRGQAIGEGTGDYQLWADILSRLALNTPVNDLEAGVLKAVIPDIGTLLHREVPDALPLGASETRERFLGVAEALFQRQQQPVVLLFEDLHLASDRLDLLVRLAQRAENSALLIVGTYRNDEKPEIPSQFTNAHLLVLGRLNNPEIEQLSSSMLGEAGKQPALLRLLEQETEGNALFLVEAVRELAKQVSKLEDIATIALPTRVTPGGVSSIIERRLQRLPEAILPLLRVAAVIGRQLDVAVLSELAAGTNVDTWLTTCSDYAMLTVANGVWQFGHDKLRQGVLTTLPEADRRLLHGQVAAAIEKIYSANLSPYLDILAYHYQMAGNQDKEQLYSRLAGEYDLANGIYGKAIQFLRRSLDLLPGKPESVQRDEEELGMCMKLGVASIGSLGYASSEVKRAFDRAFELCSRVGQTAELTHTLFGLYGYYLARAELTTAYETCQRILKLATETNNLDMVLEAHLGLFNTTFWLADFAESDKHVAALKQLYSIEKHGNHAQIFGQDPLVIIHAIHCWQTWIVGLPDQALKEAQDGLAHARALNHPYSVACVMDGMMILRQHRHEVEATRQEAEALLKASTEGGYGIWQLFGTLLMGWASAMAGQPAGVQQVKQCVDVMLSGGTLVTQTHLFTMLTEVYLKHGQTVEALETITSAVDALPMHRERTYESEMYRLKGEALLAHSPDKVVEAEAAYHRALDVARQQGALSFELRSATSLGRLWKRQARLAEARELLSQTLSRFTEGRDTPDVLEAQALLAELG